MRESFRKVAQRVSIAVGSPYVFFTAITLVISWALCGPIFGFSNTWQLFINTITTISTFLVVFLIQNTQNRESKTIQLKLDELILASKPARDTFIDLEDLADDELRALDDEFRHIHEQMATSELMRKLHAKILAEHKRRH